MSVAASGKAARAFGGAFLAASWSVVSSIAAAQDTLRIEVRGQLSAASSEALAGLALQRELQSIDATTGLSLSSVCGTDDCVARARVAIGLAHFFGARAIEEERFARGVEVQDPSAYRWLPSNRLFLPTINLQECLVCDPGLGREGTYVVIPPGGAVEEPVVLPLDDIYRQVGRPPMALRDLLPQAAYQPGALELPSLSGLDEIPSEIEKYDAWIREYDLPSNEAALRPLLDVLSDDPAVTISEGEPSTALILAEPFLGSDTQPCVPPEDPQTAELSSTLKFNESVRRLLGLRPPPATPVLVIDTGIYKALAEGALQHSFLIDEAEYLSAEVVQIGDIASCFDANGNGYARDVFGAVPRPSLLSPQACSAWSIEPVRKNEQSVQEYWPGHGGYVASLAAGGPRLQSLVDTSKYVVISAFRVTTPAQAPFSMLVQPNDIRAAFEYADTVGAEIVNLSMRTSEGFNFFADGRFLLIAAAGNHPHNLDEGRVGDFPAIWPDNRESMIIVGAAQLGASPEEARLWEKSSRSQTWVDIAAAGVAVGGLNELGDTVCMNGTSAAAPAVTFISAVVRALGLPLRDVRARILTSALHFVPGLKDGVDHGRLLDPVTAVNLYVDQVWVDGVRNVGWIEASQNLLQICSPGSRPPSSGLIDLSLLWAWRRMDESIAEFDYRENIGAAQFYTATCNTVSGSFRLKMLDGDVHQTIFWKDVQRLVPSPFRQVGATIIGSGTPVSTQKSLASKRSAPR